MTESSPSTSKPNLSTMSSPENRNKQTRAKLPEIGNSLLPEPSIQLLNLDALGSTSFVNIVLENNDQSNQSLPYFRVSDAKNDELCRVVEGSGNNAGLRKGVKYLKCLDATGLCVMLVGYPIGLGEVALLSPKAELLGECQSNVDFICLSVKVKYNFYDMNGKRRMKMTGLLKDEGNENEKKFTLIVKRSQTEKLALIKMGSLKTCCHIKFKDGETNVLERLQIIALWIGFMHNELEDVEMPALIEKHTEIKLQKKESRRNKKNLKPTPSSEPSTSADQNDESEAFNNNDSSPTRGASTDDYAVAKWMNLVKSKISLPKIKREYTVNNNCHSTGQQMTAI